MHASSHGDTHLQPPGHAATGAIHSQPHPADSVSSYFECITACSIDDGACITRCVEVLREQH